MDEQVRGGEAGGARFERAHGKIGDGAGAEMREAVRFLMDGIPYRGILAAAIKRGRVSDALTPEYAASVVVATHVDASMRGASRWRMDGWTDGGFAAFVIRGAYSLSRIQKPGGGAWRWTLGKVAQSMEVDPDVDHRGHRSVTRVMVAQSMEVDPDVDHRGHRSVTRVISIPVMEWEDFDDAVFACGVRVTRRDIETMRGRGDDGNNGAW